jgi:hypothetical protein
LVLEDHGPLTFKDKKELPRVLMIVHYFSATCGYALLDYAYILILEVKPAIARITPQVMFRVEYGYG